MSKRKLSSLICVVCREDFDVDAHIPFIGNCGHSICVICVHSIRNRCPLCNKSRAFASQKKNFQLIDVISELQSGPEVRIPRDPKDCRGCGNAIDDDKAFSYISPAIPDGSESVESFLEKAKSIRYCEACTLTEEEPGRFRRIQDIEKTFMSQKLTMSLDREKAIYLDLGQEFQEAMAAVQDARSSFDQRFPSTVKFDPDCNEQEMKVIEAKASALLRETNQLFKQYLANVYVVALHFKKSVASINRFPQSVDYDALDKDILKKVQFPENPVTTAASRPEPPQSAFTFFCKENKALVEQYHFQAQWAALEDKSEWINKETEDVERYHKEMIAYFRR